MFPNSHSQQFIQLPCNALTYSDNHNYQIPVFFSHQQYMFYQYTIQNFNHIFQNPITHQQNNHTLTSNLQNNGFIDERERTHQFSCASSIELKRTNIIENKKQKKIQQTYGRNICSNILHMIFKNIKNNPKYEEIIEKILIISNMMLRKQEFYTLLSLKLKQLSVYVSFKQLKVIWMGPQSYRNHRSIDSYITEQEFAKIFRIVARIYLKYDHPGRMHHSCKIQQRSWAYHYKIIRQILSIR